MQISEGMLAAGTSFIISATANVEPLITALITFGVTIVTMVGGEVIKYLTAYFKNKTAKLNEETKQTEETSDDNDKQ